MTRHLLALTCCLCASLASATFAAEPATPAAAADSFRPGPVTLPRSEQFELKSAKGLVYRIFISAPRGEMPAAGFGALYVLDANAYFGTAAEAAVFQKGITPSVVIGIGYPTDKPLDPDRRYYDYTPVTSPDKLRSPNEPAVKLGGTGGQDEMIAFIEHTLKPEIAKRFKIDPTQQALFGHSLGGRFVLHTMFTRPELFQSYLASSPSIWWDDLSVLKEEESFVARLKSAAGQPKPNVKLLLTVAEFEQKLAPGTTPERAAFLNKARMVDNARELHDRLAAAGLNVTFREYPDENHGTVVPGAISRGVRFAFTLPKP